MPLSTLIDARGFSRLTLGDAWPSVDELKAIRASAGSSVNSIRRVLVDMRTVKGPLPKYPELRDAIGSFDLDDPMSLSRRRAVLVSSDVQFGVARTFQAILTGEVNVFRDEASAIEWLLAGA